MLYADFESILKPVDLRYKDKMNQLKTVREGKASYTEKLNTHIPSGWCVYSKFAYGDVHCLLYTSPSPRDLSTSRMPSSA